MFTKNHLLVIAVVVGVTGCGVEVHSDSERTDVFVEPRDTVRYQIDRIDDYGYVDQQLSAGCIYLESGEEHSIYIDEDRISNTYEFQYSVRNDRLIVAIEENGSNLHRSYHRTDLFADGYIVEQNVVTGLGVTYLMTLEDTHCI
jgi:hypothetical protein